MRLFLGNKIKTRLVASFSIMMLLVVLIAAISAIQITGVYNFDLIKPTTILYCLTALLLIIMIVTLISCIAKIIKPLNYLAEVVNDVNNGDLNFRLHSDAKDELGDLENAFGKMIGTLNGLINELEYVTVAQSEGVTSVLMDAKKYKGTYSDLASLVNNMVSESNEITHQAIHTVYEIAGGKFDSKAPRFLGDKAELNETIELLRSNISTVYKEISGLVKEAADGKLQSRINEKAFGGDWYNLIKNLNTLMDAMTQPISETITVLESIAAGNLKTSMSGSYNGDFQRIKDCVNLMGQEISEYIHEISSILTSLSSGDYTVFIHGDYVGDFVQLKESINQIIDNLNRDFNSIQAMAKQFSLSAFQLSDASNKLAQGSTEQSVAVNTLTSILQNYREVSENIAHNAKEADNLLNNIDRNARDGSGEMLLLTTAMSDINKSSASISSINKMIEDIAFQINILSVNASIEAARAGAQGKGFGVVANEVRELANRSSGAAKETADVIDTSIRDVQTGTQITGKVSVMLNQVSRQITEASAIISNIAGISGSQVARTDQVVNVNTNAQDIIKVTLETASTAEETAATAQELASQASLLEATLANYRLRSGELTHIA